jgi:hypothetical protein
MSLTLTSLLKLGRTLPRDNFASPSQRNPDGLDEAVICEAQRVKQKFFRRYSEGAVLQPAETASILNELKL